jgi:Tfp pilus assembly protein PilO
MYTDGYDAGFDAGVATVVALLVLIAIVALIYYLGYASAKEKATKRAADKEREYQANVAAAGLQGMRGGNLRVQLNGLSQEHLQNVANLTKER